MRLIFLNAKCLPYFEWVGMALGTSPRLNRFLTNYTLLLHIQFLLPNAQKWSVVLKMSKSHASIATFYLCIFCPEEAPRSAISGAVDTVSHLCTRWQSQSSLPQLERMGLLWGLSFCWETLGSLGLGPTKPTAHQPVERMESLLDGPDGFKYFSCEVRKASIQILTLKSLAGWPWES